jgi:hypothetical protein
MACLLAAGGSPLRLSIANYWLALAQHQEAMEALVSGSGGSGGTDGSRIRFRQEALANAASPTRSG